MEERDRVAGEYGTWCRFSGRSSCGAGVPDEQLNYPPDY